MFLEASFTVLEKEGPHIRPLPPAQASCPSLLRLHPKPTRRMEQEVASALLGEMGQQLFPPAIFTTWEAGALAEAGLRSRGSGARGCMAWVVGPQQLQPSLGSVILGCRDTSLSMLLPVLDLALPAGKWAGEDAVL